MPESLKLFSQTLPLEREHKVASFCLRGRIVSPLPQSLNSTCPLENAILVLGGHSWVFLALACINQGWSFTAATKDFFFLLTALPKTCIHGSYGRLNTVVTIARETSPPAAVPFSFFERVLWEGGQRGKADAAGAHQTEHRKPFTCMHV